MAKKLNSSTKGRELEDFTIVFLRRLSKELGFSIDKLRRMESGTQFGKDVVWKFEVFHKRKYAHFYWVVEDKNYDKSVVSPQAIGHKLNQAHVSSLTVPIDCWAALLPKSNPDNLYSELFDSVPQGYRFHAMCWSLDELVDELIACFPDLYKQLYGKESTLSQSERKATLAKWKRRIIDASVTGVSIRESYSGKAGQKNESSGKTVRLEQKVTEELEAESLGLITSESTTKVSATIRTTETNTVEKSQITNEIDEALTILDLKPDIALEKLAIILGKVEGRNGLEHELARTYNNIGVAYNRLDHADKAVEYFSKAISVESGFIVAAANLGSTYALMAERSRNSDERTRLLKKGSTLIDPLLSNMPASFEANILLAKLSLIRAADGFKAVLSFLRDEENISFIPTIEKSASTLTSLSSMFLAGGLIDEAKFYVDKLLVIEKNAENLSLRGRCYLMYALEHNTKSRGESFEDIAPIFIENSNLELALSDFQEAIQLAISEENEQLAKEVKQFEQIAMLWLRVDIQRDGEAWPFTDNRYVEAIKAFRVHKYELSYNLLRKTDDWSQLPVEEVWRLGRTYLFVGAVEIARELLVSIEQTANDLKNYRYWIDRSMVEVLLENKNAAIYAATKAKEFANTEEQKKIALSHRGALLLRYAGEDGGDRILDNSFEFEREFPKLEILTRFDFEQDKEKVIKIMNDRREWAVGIRDKFVANPIPSYYLQKVFREPYISIWSSRDPQFTIDYTISSETFRSELQANYAKGEFFVFDYISLLTLSKLNMLYSIERYFPKSRIPSSLFEKIQEELLQKENVVLRRLWEFLRKTTSIEIVKTKTRSKFSHKKMDNLFDDWLLDVFSLAKGKKTVLVTDDFRIYRLSKSEKIVPLNTFFVLYKALEDGNLDKMMYSKNIGLLAECFYTFIGFDGDDLFQVIADDQFKLSARSYHLINQAFLGNADFLSFTRVFIPFIQKLWLSGSLSEDKIYWLSYLTNICTDMGNVVLEKKLGDELFGEIAKDSALIWNVAVTSGRIEDLEMLRADLDRILEGQNLKIIQETIIAKIDQTISKITQEKS